MTKDYSRKHYRLGWKNSGYPEFIRHTPARAFWNSITETAPVLSEYGARGKKLTATERRYLRFMKQSEAKKPYLSDSYEEMEELWEGLPGLIDQNPHIDHPWMPDPQPTRIGKILPPEPGVWILYAFTENEWCPGETRPITINGTHPIYEVEFTFPGALQPGTSFVITGGLGTPTVTIDLTADSAETGIISMRAYLEAFDAPPLPSTQGRGWTGFPVNENTLTCCEWAFYVEGADGTIYDGSFDVRFRFFKTTGTLASITAAWDSDAGAWCVVVNEPLNPTGYWVEFSISGQALNLATHAVRTQYPFLYKTADKFQAGDKIFPGAYTAKMHYYEEVEEDVWEPADTQVSSLVCSYAKNQSQYSEFVQTTALIERRIGGGAAQFEAKKKSIIRASTDYRVIYRVFKGTIDHRYETAYLTTGGPCGSRPKCAQPASTWSPYFCNFVTIFDMPVGNDVAFNNAWDTFTENDTGDISVTWIPQARTGSGGPLSIVSRLDLAANAAVVKTFTGDMTETEHYLRTYWPNMENLADVIDWYCCGTTNVPAKWVYMSYTPTGSAPDLHTLTSSILF